MDDPTVECKYVTSGETGIDDLSVWELNSEVFKMQKSLNRWTA